jgi:peptide chain release factor subunit 3
MFAPGLSTYFTLLVVISCTAGINCVCSGPSLLGALDALPLVARNAEAPLRMPVVDIFRNDRGVPTLMGKVEAGTVFAGQAYNLMPGKIPVEIISIETDISTLKSAK